MRSNDPYSSSTERSDDGGFTPRSTEGSSTSLSNQHPSPSESPEAIRMEIGRNVAQRNNELPMPAVLSSGQK